MVFDVEIGLCKEFLCFSMTGLDFSGRWKTAEFIFIEQLIVSFSIYSIRKTHPSLTLPLPLPTSLIQELSVAMDSRPSGTPLACTATDVVGLFMIYETGKTSA